jgi:ATP-binding cassette subfamily B protein
VLKNISLEIAAGSRYALVGHTGSGKTTLSRLIGRFYDVQEGRVKIDGIDVREWDIQKLRGRMAIVLQDVFLFSGTILENIRLGRQDISEEQVMEAARLVNAHEFIEKLPGGYQAEVKERGSNLSVGQKQLLSLARALVIDPDILLLDEATANIDSESEALIQKALEVVLEKRTAIVIAHRLSTIQHMDQIVVLHKGIIREQGTHQELLRMRGFYYKLYRLQYREQEIKAPQKQTAKIFID